jgi:exodeoxyribonuclease VII large subunit
VQGEHAAKDLVRALQWVNEWNKADVIILGRGGGSIEDLWAFNEEILARAVAASKIPIISAVGHETDFTICDFAADIRAATPTAAAQLAVYDHAQILDYVNHLTRELSHGMTDSLRERFENLNHFTNQLSHTAKFRITNAWQSLAHTEQLLEKVSPYAVFKRGFALVADEKNTAITSAENLQTGQNISISFADGKVLASVNQIEEKHGC